MHSFFSNLLLRWVKKVEIGQQNAIVFNECHFIKYPLQLKTIKTTLNSTE